MRLTIEWMRTLVLAAGGLLLVALLGFLALAKWKNPFNRKDLPQRLGLNIQQEANGWTYTHEQRGHTLYKIHASKLVQLKQGSNVLLHEVKIELYGEDGSRTDRIEGNEFEYDPQAGLARATGEVEITLMRPGVAPAIAPKALPAQPANLAPKGSALASAAQTAASSEIHVKTSKLIFDQKSATATTTEHVEFSLAQGTGSSMGASYDSQNGILKLDRVVELTTHRGEETIHLRAQHAEFDRDEMVCNLRAAIANYREGQATAGEAKVLFREDGSAVRLDATGGFLLQTANGGRLAAPIGFLEFNEHNQPRHGYLQDGVVLDSTTSSEAGNRIRETHTTSPTADLQFTPQGDLRHAHLERGVEMHSVERSEAAAGGPLRVERTWSSPIADVDFRRDARGQAEPERVHGTGGVVVRGRTQRGQGPVSPSMLSADQVTGLFGPSSALTALTGTGHANLEETSAAGTRQTTSGDHIDAQFAPTQSGARDGLKNELGGSSEVQSAVVEGHVVLTQQPATKPGAAPQTLRATAGHAVYQAAGEWLHLTVNPRVENGGLQLTAEKVDLSQATGDAFAHGDVKASWTNTTENGAGRSAPVKSQPGGSMLGGQGPTYVVAAEAQLHRATNEVTFRGKARMWQQANSIAAPVIVLDRVRQTLTANGNGAADPVRVVLLSASGFGASGNEPSREDSHKSGNPTVVRVRGGDLKYSDAERKAVMLADSAGSVVAETPTATSVSNQVDLLLLPPGNHLGKDGAPAQVDRLTARGRVMVTSQGRRGTGQQLVYTSETAEYVLTGSAGAPPRMTDPARGTVTGEALIFHGRDNSVSVEGGGQKTMTETTTPK